MSKFCLFGSYISRAVGVDTYLSCLIKFQDHMRVFLVLVQSKSLKVMESDVVNLDFSIGILHLSLGNMSTLPWLLPCNSEIFL